MKTKKLSAGKTFTCVFCGKIHINADVAPGEAARAAAEAEYRRQWAYREEA